MKVYELAKELETDSISLLDKLKEIDIVVKSHMSSLSAEQVEAVKNHLSPAPKAAKKKAKTVKKKATAKKGAVVRRRAKSSSAEDPATETKPKTVTKKVAAMADTPAEPTTAEPTAAAEETKADSIKIAREAAPTESPQPTQSPAAKTTVAKELPKKTVKRSDPKSDQKIETLRIKPGSRVDFKETKNRKVVQDEMMESRPMGLRIIRDAEESKPKYKDDTKPKFGTSATEAGAADRGTEATDALGKKKTTKPAVKPEDAIRIADFRKREVIFQPKRRKLPPGKQVKKTQITVPSEKKRVIKIDGTISVSEFAQRMGQKNSILLGKLMSLGITMSANSAIDFDTASLVADEFNYEVENVAFNEDSILQDNAADPSKEKDMVVRPPIITIMGHVDHGKTTLLDTIRKSNVVTGEAGGITQHIGAYSVDHNGSPISFLDTPGHSAFETMRERGAMVTDIVVLVVAADDGIMPQTIEAIKHAQKAAVPIIVAVNKIDKPDANQERIKQALAEHNLLCEDWGGQVPLVPVSALNNQGIDDLLEVIALNAEVLELKANPKAKAEGIVLEARMEKGRGPVTDVLIKNGTLRKGDTVVCGKTYGRVRSMMNDRGQTVDSVGPGYPIELYGLNGVPVAGDKLNATKDENDAKRIVENRVNQEITEKAKESSGATSIEELLAKMPQPGVKDMNVMVKADVYGSLEAIEDAINKIKSDKVKVNIVSSGVGVVTENDVQLAKTSSAFIYAFNVKPDSKAKQQAKREKVAIQSHSIIYELLDSLRRDMESVIEPVRVEKPLGMAEVQKPFNISKIGWIAGSIVSQGKVTRSAHARVIRDEETIIPEGKITSLKRFQDDVSETKQGQECGIAIQGYENIKPGDVIEIFDVEFIKPEL